MIQHRDYSGAETSQAVIVRLDPDALVACPPGSPTERFARDLGAQTAELPFHLLRHSGGSMETIRSFFRGLRGARDLRRVLRSHPEQRLVYAIGIRSGLLAALAGLGLRRRIVWSVTDLLPPRPLRPIVRSIAWLSAERSLCLSRFIADDLVGRSGRLAGRAAVVHPGIELSQISPEMRGQVGSAAAIVGHISHVKRTDLALDVAARVRTEVPDFELNVIGAAQFRDESFALERELKERATSDPALRGAVNFLGRRGDVTEALAGSKLLLHCRPDEPFGMVLVEAMALGLPVVAPAAGGPLEIVEDGVTGYLFRPGDAAEAADSVVQLLGDPERARRMGNAARKHVVDRFNAERQVELTLGLLAA